MRALLVLVLLAAVVHADTTREQLVPKGEVAMKLVAAGTLTYTCHADRWTYKTVHAELADEAGNAWATQDGLVWKAADGATLTGKVVSHAPAERPDAIPWVLYSVKGTGSLAAIKFMRRWNTVQGLARGECSADPKSFPFLAQYELYK